MPSPFPGMDPFLEDPDVWPDVHHVLAAYVRDSLNHSLPSPFYARLEMRPELGVVEEADEYPHRGSRRIIPDVLVLKHHGLEAAQGGIAVIEPSERPVSPLVEFDSLPDEPARHFTVEIRDTSRGHKLVTLIEILSPSNKRPGPDFDSYATKQREVLESDASLVEIDLLRSGKRPIIASELEETIKRLHPSPDYIVLVSPAWKRRGSLWGYKGYPFRLRDPLPCVGIPLKAELPEVPLDLRAVFNRVYDGGPYLRGAVDYTAQPDPPLLHEDALWADELLRQRGLRTTPVEPSRAES